MSSGTCWHCEGDHDTGACPTRKQWTKGEHQPGSPGVDLDALERRLELDLGSWGNSKKYAAVFAELRTLRARVGELEAENARLDRFRQLALADVEKARLKAEQYDRDWYGLRGEFDAAKARAESAEARVKELEHQVEFHPWRVRDLETMIQNEHKLYADAHERMLKAEARVKELEAIVNPPAWLKDRITDLEAQLAAAREEQSKWKPVLDLVLNLREFGSIRAGTEQLYDCIDKITGLRKFHADGTWHTGERCAECAILEVEAKGG